MSSYDLLHKLSELDEDLIMKPRKFVSLRLNLLFCVISSNISALIPHGRPALCILVFLFSFWGLYGFAAWFLNRNRKRKLLIEPETGEK